MARAGGRRSKGPRKQFTLRVPEVHAERYLAEADAAGIDINDYLAIKLAEAHDLPLGSAPDSQLDLPLATVGANVTRRTSAA